MTEVYLIKSEKNPAKTGLIEQKKKNFHLTFER